MEKLKSYYTNEAEKQPDPSIKITFEQVSEKRRLNIVRRTILLAAVIAILTASALAVGTQLFSRAPEWFSIEELIGEELIGEEPIGEEEGNIAQIEINAPPFSADFRAYIDADDWMREDSWDGQFSSYTFAENLEFSSMAAVSEFFNINIARNSLMPDASIEIYKTLVAYDPIFDNARITVFSNAIFENNRLVSINLDFHIDNEQSEPFSMSYGFYNRYGFGVEEGTEQYYISLVNGIEALLLPISLNSAQAIFALDNIVYTLSIHRGIMMVGDDTVYNSDIHTTESAIEVLKEIIDAFHF